MCPEIQISGSWEVRLSNRLKCFGTQLGAQSLTSLMADVRQDINRVSSFITGALMEHFLEGIAPLRYLYINSNEKSNRYKSSLLS